MKRLTVVSLLMILLSSCGAESGASGSESWDDAAETGSVDAAPGPIPVPGASSVKSAEGDVLADNDAPELSSDSHHSAAHSARAEIGTAELAQTRPFTQLSGCYASIEDCDQAVINAFFIQLQNCVCEFATTQGCDFDHPLGVLCEP